MLKKILITFSIILLVLFISIYVLLFTGSIPKKSNVNISLAEASKIALQKGGDLPIALNSMIIGSGDFFKGGAVAGEFKNYRFPFPSYQILYRKANVRKSIIVDTAMNFKMMKSMKTGNPEFSKTNFKKLQKALVQCSQIIITHGHFDHIGSLMIGENKNEFLKKTVLSDIQYNTILKGKDLTKNQLNLTKMISYQKYYFLSPGVVLIKNPGHSPGHQMIYVILKDKTEYLLAGDTAWHRDHMELRKNRPLLISLLLKEDRNAVAHQIAWLREKFIVRKNRVNLILSHDYSYHRILIKKGILGKTFSLQ